MAQFFGAIISGITALFATVTFNPVTFFLGLAFNFLGAYLFAPKHEVNQESGVQASVRETTPARQYVFGETIVGGAVIYQSTRGFAFPLFPFQVEDIYLDLVITLATHPVESVLYVQIYGKPLILEEGRVDANGEPQYRPKKGEDVDQSQLDALGIDVSLSDQKEHQDRFRGKVKIQYRLDGTTSPFIDLQNASSSDWSSTDQGQGLALVWMTFIWDQETFTSGVPSPTFLVRGANNIFDPRDETKKYTHNPALIANWILQEFPTGIDQRDVDQDVLIESANTCEVQETYNLEEGGSVTEDSYQAHGRILTTDAIIRTLEDNLAIAMAGVIFYSRLGGWQIFAAKFVAPSASLSPDDIKEGTITIQPKVEYAERFNAVVVTYRSTKNQQLTTEAPQITNQQYQEEDGRVLQRDFNLEFVTSVGCAQRLAQQLLKRARSELTVRLEVVELNKGLSIKIWDTVQLDYPAAGISSTFKVLGWRSVRSAASASVALILRETNASEFTYNPDFELYREPGFAPSSDIGGAQPPPLTGLALLSGNDNAVTYRDGTVVSAIRVTWDMTTSPYSFDTQITWSGGSDGQAYTRLNEYKILPVRDNETYTVSARHRNSLGTLGTAQTKTIDVTWKTTPPSTPIAIRLNQGGTLIVVIISGIVDRDSSHIELRYKRAALGEAPLTISFEEFNNGVGSVGLGSFPAPYSEGRDFSANVVLLQSGVYTFAARLFDTSGNGSAGILTAFISFIPPTDLLACFLEEPQWEGTRVGYFDLGLDLYPTGNILTTAATSQNWLAYDWGSPGIATDSYLTREADLGSDHRISVKADISYAPQPQSTVGVDFDLAVCFHAEGDVGQTEISVPGATSDERLANLSAGISVQADGSSILARYVNLKIRYNTSSGHRTPVLHSVLFCILEI